ncbi:MULTISPECIES: GSU2403 family nucleotidyltransferase fold protein [unclassified Oleiphilus]|uniref:GSU2403 family nucleotidyltransferase fold protein n=1 Tax=unclassified Oleiphilus TaxID=2631174 RepID=UPI0007C39F67|nr:MULTISPECIES: GSU2403 family nucleotidyltransferase fold protein [unclassified Oleiphilus]KZY34649.1 hypothetical protein A3729_18110 [Oleiphilus sp. HI0043]KZZ66194.1 hypothetical protein A3763_17805 [Oleiphilus sp. HI0128]
MSFLSVSNQQAKVIVDARQSFEAWKRDDAWKSEFTGSMHWKVIKGKQYLYRGYTGGKNISLGARNAETEELKAKFEGDENAALSREKLSLQQVKIHAAFLRAVSLNRFPVAGAKVIRALQKQSIPHKIIETNAMYAYEIAGGVLFNSDHLATQDIDVLFDSRQCLKVVSSLDQGSLLGLLQKTDKSFQPLSDSPREFAAVNAQQYRVDFITQGKPQMQASEFESLLDDSDLLPVEIDSLKWVLSAPTFEQIVFDSKGMPVRLNAIDPRAFVLHKWYVSKQPDRDRVKAVRDESQARSVASLLRSQLTHLSYGKAINKIFPSRLQDQVSKDIDEFDL